MGVVHSTRFKTGLALLTAAVLAFSAVPVRGETIVLPGIIGSDERQARKSDSWPWIAIGRVNKSGSGHCTGTLVAPDLVVTASHCLLNKRTGRMHRPESIKFVAGYDRGEYRAVRDVVEFGFPDCSAYAAPVRGIEKMAFDVVALRLAEPIKDIEPVAVAGREDVRSSNDLYLAGYQQDRPYMLSVHGGCTQQRRSSSEYLLAHKCDATRGASGGPLLVETADGWRVVGFHVGSVSGRKHQPSVLGLASTAVADGLISGSTAAKPGSCTPVRFLN